jgi:hypothetical protein
VAGTLTSTDASALANGVVVGGNAGMGTAAASGSGAWFGPTGGNSITAGTENGVMAAPTYMDITSPGSIQAQATTTFSLAIGSIYSFTALSASTSGVTLNGTTTIGSGTGTAVLTSGVVSTLSGTNLVLGNSSTIPQSTFQPALSGGTTGALTKWTGSSTLGNAAWSDIQTGIGSQGAGLALMGPTSGPNASPTFRSIINTDLGSVAWGGSLAGTGPNPDVRGIWGLSVPTPTAGNLRYNGSAYAWDGTSYATSASLGSYLPLVAGSGNPLSGELYASASGTAILAGTGRISSAAIAVDALNAYNASLATGNNIGLAVGKSGALNQSGYVYWVQGATDAASVLHVDTYAGGNPIEFNGSKYTFDGSGTATFSGTTTAISVPNGEITSRGNNVVTSILRSYRASQALTSSYASIVSALAGSTTIPANSLSVGDVLHIYASIPSAAGGGTWNLIQYFNGSSIGAAGPSATTGGMVYDAYATVITTGSSGTMEINQNYLFPSPAMYSTGVFSINTTTTNTFDVDAIVSGSATIAYPAVTIEKL